MAATKYKKGVSQQLALATCTLLSHQAGAEAIENEWVFDSSFASYKEGDDRVSVEKFVANVGGNISETDNVDMQVVFDTMTGATPTGAVETSNVVSVTGTSGAGGFTAGGQATALAPFDDTRLAVDFGWESEHSRTFRSTFGAAVSVESDYTSMGASFDLAKDTEDKLMTFATGLSFSHDTISQTGGQTPAPLSNVNEQSMLDEGERNSFELMFGLTNVLGRRTVWQNNVWFGYSDGYHTDPYKVVSVANEDDVEFERLYESRPGDRQRNVYYSKLVHRVAEAQTMHLSYRYYSDDWEVKSHTIDLKYRFDLTGGQYIEPQLRGYSQTGAEFFTRAIAVDEFQDGNLPEFATADNRLDDSTGATVGLKFGKPVGENGEARVRISGIAWRAENAVIADTDAVLLQLNFKKGFY